MSPAKTAPSERILAAAFELFARRGFDEVTMTDIAAAAGVARATVFNHFRSKHALVVAITASILNQYRDLLDGALADETTPTSTLLRDLFEAMGKGIESERHFFRGVFRELVRVQVGLDESGAAQRAAGETSARLVRLIARGQARGDLTTEVSAVALTDALEALTSGTITQWLYRDAVEPLTPRMRDAIDVFLIPVERTPRTRRSR